MPGTRSSADPLREPSRPGRLAGAGVLAAGALVLVVAALAAGSDRADDGVLTVSEAGAEMVFDVFIVLVTIYSLVVVGLLILSIVRERDPGEPGAGRQPFTQILGMVALGIVMLVALRHSPELGEIEPVDVESTTTTALAPADPVEPAMSGPLTWVLVVVLVVIAGVILAWAIRRRDERLTVDDDPDADAVQRRRNLLIGLLDDAIRQLRDHPDPRAAVIAVWARLEAALEVVGVHRERADTPMRYLARVLAAVDASAPAVERLTAAFERAMFSDHRIDRTTQLEAIDALVAVRDELDVLAAAGSAATRA